MTQPRYTVKEDFGTYNWIVIDTKYHNKGYSFESKEKATRYASEANSKSK